MLGVVRTVVQPTVEPLTLGEARDQVRVLDGDSDAYLSARIVAARQFVEARLNRQLMTATLEMSLDRFPTGTEASRVGGAGVGGGGGVWEGMAASRRKAIVLRRAPAVSVVSVKYLDGAGVEQTLAADRYRLVVEEPALVVPSRVAGWSWPTAGDEAGAVVVRYVAGWAEPEDVPGPIKDYMLLLIGAMFENRALEVTGTISTPLKFAEGMMDAWKVYE